MRRNRCVGKLKYWSVHHRLTINPSKSKYKIFSFKKINCIGKLNLDIDHHALEQVEVFDYLGIRLDSRLTFEEHVKKIIVSCNDQLTHLCKIRKFISPNIAVPLYKSYIFSWLNYGLIFCVGIRAGSKKCLQMKQNRAFTCFLSSSRYESNYNLHIAVGVIPVCLGWKRY